MLLMLLDFCQWLAERWTGSPDIGPFRVFQYITVRAGAALAVAFLTALIVGPRLIARLRSLGAGQVVRRAQKEGAISLHTMHGGKEGTPTMGGLIVMAALLAGVALFCRLTSVHVLLLLAVSLGFGALGFWDDYLKVVRKNHLGVSARKKLFWQGVIGLALGAVLMQEPWEVIYAFTGDRGYAHLLVPFFKTVYPAMGLWFLAWVALVMAGTSNAVNLTDGLDGLAIGITIVSFAAFTVIAYLASRVDYSSYLFIPHVPGAGEIVVFGGAMVGASFGFLWFNSHPAEVFMGDAGSMMLGGTLGAMALMLKQELLLLIVGGMFVIEALSVLIQVGSFRLRGKRVFLMSPLHHHYEKRGLHESKIIIRFWTVAALMALLGLATMKLR